jgi:signal transduction histidine kinase
LAKLKKPVSRLILLFILMVFISGVILTFLSINNITNFRILTEKKIQETQLEIAGQISIHFNQKLQVVTENFSGEWRDRNSRLPADFIFFTFEQIPVLPFSLDEDGKFIWPWYIEIGQVEQSKISSAVQQDLTSGESDEFQREDYQKAFVHYSSALSKSRAPGDSAKVFSALGRISTKMKKPDKSWYYYSSLFPRLSSETSPVGMPYGYFAISQIIKLPLPEKQAETVGLARLFLEQLDNGIVPLNLGTETILEELNTWFTTKQVSGDQNKKFHFLTERVKSKLDFIANYSGDINEIIHANKSSELPVILNQFSVYAINRSDNPELMVVNQEKGKTAGFILSLNDLWNSAKSHLPKEISSEYIIELVPGSASLINQDALSIRAELSPYFPVHRIVIRPANEHVIEKYVRSRSWTYGIALVLLLGGMSLGIVLIIRDINREKRIADMQSEFVSHVTHELKTPLTSINMFAETIFFDRAKTPELRKKYANIIMKESEVLKRKIDNILEYSARKNEKSKYRIRENNLTVLVGEVMEEMKYWLDINEFEVTLETEPDVIANVDADGIKQALSNLIGNAIKYSSDRKHLFVRLFSKEGKIMIEVEDTGIGIPKDQTDLIFEKFYRVKSHENESATGTGLGLSVTRDIVNAHGGKIFVESEINSGSKFIIQLNS